MSSFEDSYRKLNSAQARAVDSLDGPLLVIAGPGTGKTELLSMRVANILRKTDANPSNILCLTFTEAAAKTMRERLSKLIGEASYKVAIHTFHSFGAHIIQNYPQYFLDQPLLHAVDELGTYELLSDIFSGLPASNPLHLKINDRFLYLTSTQSTISWLKQAGLSPSDLRANLKLSKGFIDYANPQFAPAFATTPDSKQLAKYQKLLRKLDDYASRNPSIGLAKLCTAQLAEAIDAVDSSTRHAPSITAWRNRWLKQTAYKSWVMADLRRNRLFRALTTIYERYQAALAKNSWYTYDDMILSTINALRVHDELRLALQEQYQYMLVDEYQDTNGAQNLLLELLAGNPVNEDRPNLMVVGDDDQAIYRFQGAYTSVMIDFIKRWRDVKEIVLTVNYRSTKAIVQLAHLVITQGQERLENLRPEINKNLVAVDKSSPKLAIVRTEAISEIDQYMFVAKKISELIKKGHSPNSIAVLAPKHQYLKALVPYLIDQGVPITYERRDHILQQAKVGELINLARLVEACAQGNWNMANAMLPTVLAASYWQLEPQLIWELSVEAYRQKRDWLSLMANSKHPILKNLARALPTLSKQALTQSLETMLDILLGNQSVELTSTKRWTVPYKAYHFSPDKLEYDPLSYFTLLGQLTTLRERLRAWRPTQTLQLNHFLEFIDLVEQSQVPMLDTNPHALSSNAVELLTAYKAKGQEWRTVFLLACHNDVWGTTIRTSNSLLTLPSDLSWIKPARDSADDHLRLFFVALTRAKQTLYLLSFAKHLNGQASEPLAWLMPLKKHLPEQEYLPAAPINELIHEQELHWGLTPKQQHKLSAALGSLLKDYQLNASALMAFLDITRGGPKHFLFSQLLHFPEAASTSAVFGSCMHQTLHYVHTELTHHKRLPPPSKVRAYLRHELAHSNLAGNELAQLEVRGQMSLKLFYQQISKNLKPTDKSEFSFGHEACRLGDVRLSGRVDVLRQTTANELVVIDYKTGSPFHKWQPIGAYPSIRARLYQHQLYFYKLLVDTSTIFTGQQLNKGIIQFVEADDQNKLPSLELQYDPETMERTKKLLIAVWRHILKLDFPDITKYPLTPYGLRQFEDDLINGTV